MSELTNMKKLLYRSIESKYIVENTPIYPVIKIFDHFVSDGEINTFKIQMRLIGRSVDKGVVKKETPTNIGKIVFTISTWLDNGEIKHTTRIDDSIGSFMKNMLWYNDHPIVFLDTIKYSVDYNKDTNIATFYLQLMEPKTSYGIDEIYTNIEPIHGYINMIYNEASSNYNSDNYKNIFSTITEGNNAASNDGEGVVNIMSNVHISRKCSSSEQNYDGYDDKLIVDGDIWCGKYKDASGFKIEAGCSGLYINGYDENSKVFKNATHLTGNSISITNNDKTISISDGNIVVSGNINASTGTITANTFDALSDRRLKTNIVDYTPKKSILDLPVVEFDYITTEKHAIGCIAQDLQKICPEIVDEDDKGYLSIQESKIVYLLLDEVKKLRKELDELKERE